MRSEFNRFANLNAIESENLASGTKKNIATDIHAYNGKTVFTAADFWNIQSKRRIRIPGGVFTS